MTVNKLSHIIRTGKVEIIPNLHFWLGILFPSLFISFYFTDRVGCVN